MVKLLVKECSKLDEINENQSCLFGHKSTPVHYASKGAHRRILEKQRLNWFEMLNDSESEEDDLDTFDDTLTNNLMLLNLTQTTYKYHDTKRSNVHLFDWQNRLLSKKINAFTKSDKKSLKTNYLRNQISTMMKKSPEESTVWQYSFLS
jgi:hypothetical protein